MIPVPHKSEKAIGVGPASPYVGWVERSEPHQLQLRDETFVERLEGLVGRVLKP
jgi:hypothetical protein